ncbi:hypothetical protein F5148DRAFT_1245376, partial [Russula earlei]
MTAGADVDGAVVLNRAGLPVLGGFNGLLDDGVDLDSEAGSAGIGGDVAEEFVQLGFAQALEFAAIIGTGSLRGEDDVGLAANDVWIVAREIESEEGRAVGEIILDRDSRPERSLRAHLVFLREWVLPLAKRRVGPGEAKKERVERLPLGLVVTHDSDDVGKTEDVEAAVGKSEVAAKEMAGSAWKTCASCLPAVSTGHEFSLDAIELGDASRILRIPIQQSAKTPPFLP